MPFLLPALGVLLAVGLLLSALFSRPRSRIRALIGVAIVLAIVALTVEQERVYANIDLNPTIPRWQSLAGTWRRGNTTVVLSPDGRWHCATTAKDQAPCDGELRNGRWRLSGRRNLEFEDPHGARVIAMPVITDHGRFRLLKVPDEDPDSWDVSRGYERVTGAYR